MALEPVACRQERFGDQEGHVYLPSLAGEAADRFSGTVQLAVLDRPEAAEGLFQWKSGADDWLTNRPSLTIPIHHNRTDGLEEYLACMEKDLRRVHELLSDTGSAYVFASQRSSARVRLLLDDVFGRSNFLNEIIWAHDAGLRPSGRFTRSHDTIFFYRKGKKSIFNAIAAGRERGRLKSHMRRVVENGRAYYTRQAGGREYRYFEDETVSIGDVWTDIPEIPAKDEERTGWDVQRPEALLHRMIAAATHPGGRVLDVCSQAATTAAVAGKTGRRALLVGASPAERMLARRQLLEAGAGNLLFVSEAEEWDSLPEVGAALSDGSVRLHLFHRSCGKPALPGSLLDDGLGSLEYWAAGRMSDGAFSAQSWAMRTRRQPTLPQSLPLGPGDGRPCIHLVDACGEQWFFLIK